MPVCAAWIDRLERRVARWCKHGLGKAWVLAVSGGGDSVGLLRVLHEISGPLGLRCQSLISTMAYAEMRPVPTPPLRRRSPGRWACRLSLVRGGPAAVAISSPMHAALAING